ncbi:MAG: hypothetical protein MUC96_18935 [Myxococcaceae bacterium]|nr:hypothetical protein [Myxococcaceae bacterium]
MLRSVSQRSVVSTSPSIVSASSTPPSKAPATPKVSPHVSTGDTFELAKAQKPRSRPVESRPSPNELTNRFHGQRGASSNQTGRIGGAAELAQFVNAGYNGTKEAPRFGPLSITPATLKQGDKKTSIYLVGISGTEQVRDQSTGWVTNFKSGFEKNNPGLRNAKDALFRTVPEGSSLVMAGHSQGGMIAQQLAADPEVQKRYKLVSTVTYGSPLIAAGRREGEVHRIAAAGDPVPRLSGASLDPRTFGWALLGQQNIRTDFPIKAHDPRTWKNGVTAHNNDYVSENNPDLAKMDALGRVNPRVRSTIEFNPADRVFFTSPTDTSAP